MLRITCRRLNLKGVKDLADIKHLILLITLLFTVGCSYSARYLEKPVGGYDAIRFNQSIEVRDHAFNWYSFQVGSVLINDRKSEYTNLKLYCGTLILNGRPMFACIGLEDKNTIIIGPGGGFKEVNRNIPEGAISLIKIQ